MTPERSHLAAASRVAQADRIVQDLNLRLRLVLLKSR
jgi:hypothetical protein